MAPPSEIWYKSWQIASVRSQAEMVCQTIVEAVRQRGYNGDDVFGVHLALEEALANAIQHGNRNDPEKKIRIESLVTPEKVDISVTDEGSGFEPDALPDPRTENNLTKCSGRGVLLIKAYMDVVEFNAKGNCIHMIKFKKQSSKST